MHRFLDKEASSAKIVSHLLSLFLDCKNEEKGRKTLMSSSRSRKTDGYPPEMRKANKPSLIRARIFRVERGLIEWRTRMACRVPEFGEKEREEKERKGEISRVA